MNELFVAVHAVHALDSQANRVPEEASQYCLKIKAGMAQSPINCQTVKIRMLTLRSQTAVQYRRNESIFVPIFIVPVASMRVVLRLPSQKCHTGTWHGLPSVPGGHLPPLHLFL